MNKYYDQCSSIYNINSNYTLIIYILIYLVEGQFLVEYRHGDVHELGLEQLIRDKQHRAYIV